MDQKTIDTYNKMAAEYDEETVDFWDRFPRTFLDKFIELSPKSANILDVGAGPGRDALLLQQRGLDIVCLDASETMVHLTEQRGLKSLVGDLMSLPFDNEIFEAVWAYTSLLHVPKDNIGKALQEIRRVLKSNGCFALGLIEGNTEGYRNSSGIQEPRWFSFYTKQEIEDLLQSNHFEIIYFEQFKPKSKNYLNFIARKTTNSHA